MKRGLGKVRFCALCFVFLMGGAFAAFGKEPAESVGQAVQSHADVQALLHGFRASTEEREAARGAFKPKADLSASVGWESLSGSGYTAADRRDYFREGVYLVLSQMIYDGNQTNNQVKRLGHARVSKYYELLGAMEKVALLAFRSHLDVVRYREMAVLARENLAHHEEIVKKIEERTGAGLDSAIDKEVARGRLALAQVNLMTEESNLHDATTQYYRAVGAMPDDALEMGLVDFAPPSADEEVAAQSTSSNSRWTAASENVQAARYAVEEQRSRLRPRVDLRGGYNLEDDSDKGRGRRDKAFVELAMRYNLYNGGSDEATIRRFIELRSQSEEILKRTEQDIRQALLIAFNNFHAVKRQLPHLERHQAASEAMEKAYLQQFEVGRRSLLDLLDAQNEYYQARRSYRNALFNLENAKVSYLAESGEILRFFNVLRQDVPTREALDTPRKSSATKKAK